MSRYQLHFLTILFFLPQIVGAQFTSQSVLSEGTFYKVGVQQSGVYKLDKAFFESLPNVGTLNPNMISIWGNRGGMLPEVIAEERIDDVKELPVRFVGNADNEFGSDEYFLFYAEGPEILEYNDNSFSRENNIYEEWNYYFVSTSKNRSKNINSTSYSGIPQSSVSTYDDYQKYDNDLVNVLGKNFGTQGSGKTWYGEEFTNDRRQDFTQFFDDSHIVDGSEVKFRLEMLARSDNSSTMFLHVNDQAASRTMSSVNIFDGYASYGSHRWVEMEHTFSSSTGIQSIECEMRANSNRFFAWLDYISMQSIKSLNYSNKPLHFRRLSSDTETLIEYRINNNGANLEIWEVTDPTDVRSLIPTNSNGQLVFNAPEGKEFVAFSLDVNFENPKYFNEVEPQNLHGIVDAEYVILYHSDFEEAARRLADHRAAHDNLVTYVIDIEQVFNEFACGSKDPIAIRDFAHMLFDRSGLFQYLCLFGDASYDYRGLDSELPKDNYIPCYQTDESLSPVFAFPTDDFFALLSDNEGGDLKGGVDIAVGRLPVASLQEANTVVNKLIGYDTDPDFNGEWKNNFILVADDEDQNNHLNQTERLADLIASDRPEFNQRKIYFDAFEQISTTGDARYPDAKQKLNDYIFQGALMLNYFGHGGPNGWAQERVLEIQDILSWKNAKKLPLFITATCTFTGYDDPADKSGGELTLLNPNGGSIGLVSTTRAVTISANERLVNSMFEFIYDKEKDEYLRIGEVLRLAKNNHRSDTLERNARKFALIGDPAMRLSFPEYSIAITKFQNQDVDPFNPDTIRALDAVTFEGEVRGFENELLENFNGTLEATVMDKAKTYRTLANDSKSKEADYKAYDAFLFKGNTQVVNGKFSVSFRVPKDINYSYGPGRLSLYATQSGTEKEASGYFDDFIIGGSSEDVVEDIQPPAINLFLNSIFFKDGDVTGPDPLLIAQVSDDLGINISNTAIGHEMIAILDEDLPGQIILNDYYQAAPNSFTEGVIEYPFNNLEEGEHTLRVRVWDVANNPTEATITFIVEKGRVNQLENVAVVPNPAIDNVEFSFTHQLRYTPIDVYISIYNQLGQQVSEVSASVTTGGNSIENIEWNRVGYSGQILPSGVYHYKINTSSTSATGDVEMAESSGGKIVLLN